MKFVHNLLHKEMRMSLGNVHCPFTGKKRQRFLKTQKVGKLPLPKKGDKYRACPACLGIGGNHVCARCFGSGTVRIGRGIKDDSGKGNSESYRPSTARNRQWWNV